MANPQHAKTPRLNALLVGKRTVPSGCKVLNVSQQGMSLQCDPDGRLLTFTSGDAVDIYLSVQHANGHNKFTIPAIISHVDESIIDVVFHCTDTELAGLIESYRTSESHNLEASIDHRLIRKASTAARPVAVNQAHSNSGAATSVSPRSSWSFYTTLLLVFVSGLLALASYYYISTVNKRLATLESISQAHTEELAEVQSQVFSSRLQDGRYASLNARMKALTDAFQSFEKRVSQSLAQGPDVSTPSPASTSSRLARTMPPTGNRKVPVTRPETTSAPAASKPPSREAQPARKAATPDRQDAPKKAASVTVAAGKPAEESIPSVQKYPAMRNTPAENAGKPESETRNQRLASRPTTTPAKTSAPPAVATSTAAQTNPAVADATPSGLAEVQTGPSAIAGKDTAKTPATVTPATRDDGPWVINILSSPSKRYVEEMQASARTHGFDASIARAEVKGKEYWRLQLPGFASMSAARKAAEPLKAELDIANVWIFKRSR